MALKDDMIKYRAKHDMPIKVCASKAGITAQTWQNVERGLQNPSRMTEGKIRLLIEEEE